jgi:hypothetical protein
MRINESSESSRSSRRDDDEERRRRLQTEIKKEPKEVKIDWSLLGREKIKGPAGQLFDANPFRGQKSKGGQGEIVRDPDSPNKTPTPETIAAAAAAVAADRAAEQAARAALSPDGQKAYDAAAAVIQGDIIAVRELQTMLISGRFSGGGEELLKQLGTLATQPVAAGIDQAALVADVIQEIADPVAITQGSKGTCGPTAALLYLAKTDPAEYVRLVQGLAGPAGVATMKNGQQLFREPGTEVDDMSGRTQSQRLLQPALMEYAYSWFGYDNASDTLDGVVKEFPGGLLNIGTFDGVIEALTGQTFDSHGVGDAAAELAKIETAGKPVFTELAWDNLTHYVLVTRVDKDHAYYINPWGQEERMPRGDFQNRMVGVSYPP